jgi:putative polyhydroxyalkanoate system protein
MKVRREHSLGAVEARRRVDEIAADMGTRLNLQSEWRDDDLQIKGSGVNGKIAVNEDAIEIQLELGYALILMENSIRVAIENAMDKHLS